MNFSQVLQEFASLTEVLIWVASAGGAMYLFGIVEARLLENWVRWHSFPLWVKKVTPIVISALLAMLANVLITVDVTQFIPESLAVVLLAAINWVVSQLDYEKIKQGQYGKSTREQAEKVGSGS